MVKRLDALIGRRKTEGRTTEAPGVAHVTQYFGSDSHSNWRPWMDITLTRVANPAR
jgi:hypothetical protein